MPKYGRKRARSAPSRYKRRPAGRRYKSKARKTAGKKLVTVKMLKNRVPRTELKYFANQDGINGNVPNTFQIEAFWINAFIIPQGVGLGQRVGNSVWLKMIEVAIDVVGNNNPDSRQDVLTDLTGAASHGNLIANANLDMALRLVIVDSVMDTTTSLPSAPLELLGSPQTNSYGGASEYYELLDKLQIHSQKRMIRMDKKIMHHKGVLEYPYVVGAATRNGMFGFRPVTTEKTHKFVIKFPGQGYKLQYDTAGSIVPSRMPIAYVVGKNADPNNNPILRWATVRLWFTDP